MDYLNTVTQFQELMTLLGDFPLQVGQVERVGSSLRFCSDTVEVTANFEDFGNGVLRRQDTVKNVSARAIQIRTAYSKFNFNGGQWDVYTQYNENCAESQGLWQPLHTEISAGCTDLRVCCNMTPFMGIWNLQTQRGWVFHLQDACQWNMKARRNFTQSGRPRNTTVELGPDNGNFSLTLQPGESFSLPRVVFYPMENRTDLDAWRLHRYCNKAFPAKKMPVTYNSWMSHFDFISFEQLQEQLNLAKELGCEYFVIDAGWFGEPGKWFPTVGDWEESTEFGLKGRMAEFAELVRKTGLKFGLWFEIERAGLLSQAMERHPEYYLKQGDHGFVDFSKDDARDFVLKIVCDHIRHYGIDYIKFDFNAMLSFDLQGSAFLNYYEGYGKFIAAIRTEFPGIYLDGCASGGMRMALTFLQYFDSFWLSDEQNIHLQMDIFRDTLLRMPPRVLERWITVRTLEQFGPNTSNLYTDRLLTGDGCWNCLESTTEGYVLASMTGGPMSLSCDLSRIAPEFRAKLAERIAQFKEHREFWMHAECRVLTHTESLTVLQFCDEALQRLHICAYVQQRKQKFADIYPVADPSATYRMETEDGDIFFTGEELMTTGLQRLLNALHKAEEIVLTKVQ